MNEQMTVSYQLENETGADWKVASGGTTLINADTVKNYLNYIWIRCVITIIAFFGI